MEFDPSQPFEEVEFDPSQPFEADSDPMADQGPPISKEEMQRASFPVAERARSALRKMQAGKPLLPDEADAVKQMLRGPGRSRDTYSALETAQLHGGNAAMLDWGDEAFGAARAGLRKLKGDPGQFNDLRKQETRAIRDALAASEAQHPGVAMASRLAGSVVPAAVAPGGAIGAAATGTIAGVGGTEADNPVDWILPGAAGGALGAAAYGAAKYLPPVIKKGAEHLKGAGGKAAEITAKALRKVAGLPEPAAAPAPHPYAAEVKPGSSYVTPEDVTQPFIPKPEPPPPPEAVTQTMQGLPSEAVTKTMRGADIRSWHPATGDDIMKALADMPEAEIGGTVAKRAPMAAQPQAPADDTAMMMQAALRKLPENYRANANIPQPPPTADEFNAIASKVNEQGAKKFNDPAAWFPAEGRDTAITPLDDVLSMKQRALRDNIDKVGDLMQPEAQVMTWQEANAMKSPAQKAAAKFDNASGSLDMQALDSIVKGGASPQPKPAGTVSPIDAARQKIIDAQKANPDALKAFGVDPATVDPRSGERGFDMIASGLGYLGAKAAARAGKIAAKPAAGALDYIGKSMQESARQSLTPDAMARSTLANPSVLFHLAKQQGQLGQGAKAVLEAMQANDQVGLKARVFALSMMPEFRALFAQDTGDQGQPARAASAR